MAVPVSAASPEVGETLSIASSASLVRPPVVPDTTTPLTAELIVSDVSASVTVRVPDVVRPALVSAIVALAVSVPTTAITGASLVPVRVMVTVSVALAPNSSVTLTVKLSVVLAPSARVLAAALSSV